MDIIVSNAAVKSLCMDEAMLALIHVDDLELAFIAELGKESKPLPKRFTVDDEAWDAARAKIDHCIAALDLRGTIEACLEYKQGAVKYLNSWRVKLGLPLIPETIYGQENISKGSSAQGGAGETETSQAVRTQERGYRQAGLLG